MEQVVHGGQRADQTELLLQESFDVGPAQRADPVFGRRAGVDSLAYLLLLIGRERRGRLAAAMIFQPRQALFVEAIDPLLTDP